MKSRERQKLARSCCLIAAFAAGSVVLAQDPAATPAATKDRLSIVKATWTVAGQNEIDVTRAVSDSINQDRLDIKATPDDLGIATANPKQRGVLTITYTLDGNQKTARFVEGKEVWIAAFSKEDALSVDKLLEIRKRQPEGLAVVRAQYGVGNRWKDVTNDVRRMVFGNSLTIPVNIGAFGDPAPGASGKTLELTYSQKETELQNLEENDGATIQIGPQLTAIVPEGGGLLNVASQLAERRKSQPYGLIILNARYGGGGGSKDVTNEVRRAVAGDSVTIPVNIGAFGDPAPGSSNKTMKLAYSEVGDDIKTVDENDGATIQIGPRRTAIVALGGGLLNLVTRLADLRKQYPTGLVILDARYGSGGRSYDVTDKMQSIVSGNDLSVIVSAEAFGDPAYGQAGKSLMTTYDNGKDIVTVNTLDGDELRIGTRTTSFVDIDRKLVNVYERLEKLQKEYGSGLIILDAQYGAGSRQDVREFLQKSVVNNALRVTVGDKWPDPAQGSMKEIKVCYWDGKEVRFVRAPQGALLELKGETPAILKGFRPLPEHVVEGTPISYSFGGQGVVFALRKGPTGASLSPDGKLTWTPSAEQIGGQQLQLELTKGAISQTQVVHVEVVPKSIAKATGNTGNLDDSLRLDLGRDPAIEYGRGLDGTSGLVLCQNELLVVNPDGISVQKRIKLPKEYSRILERDAYYLGLANDPKSLDLLDKTTLRPIKTIRLPYRGLTDLAIHPASKTSYVAVEDRRDDGPRYRVVIVDEESGDVREPKNVIGRYLATSPDGKHLYAGLKDVYQKGIHLFINPDGQIWDTPNYGEINLLIVFSLEEKNRPKLQAFKERAGANGNGICLSNDGKRLTYLSASGYPADSGAVPAWDPADLEKLPITYECKGQAPPTKIAYHPSQPLVAIPAVSGPLLFNRETGDPELDRVRLPTLPLQNAKIEDAFFSPDGRNVILELQRGGNWYLYKVPLIEP